MIGTQLQQTVLLDLSVNPSLQRAHFLMIIEHLYIVDDQINKAGFRANRKWRAVGQGQYGWAGGCCVAQQGQ